MDLKELQEIKDAEYANSLGYNTNFVKEDELIEYQSEHLFDYEQKTMEYLDSMYY